MKKSIYFVVLSVIFSIAGIYHSANAEDQEEQITIDQKINKELLKQKLPFDIIYGEETAPVTIVEYASLSCSHCKDFYKNVFLAIKEKYIDTGKVRLVYRHFPLNLPALRGTELVSCMPSEEMKKRVLAALFKSQEEWAYAESEKAFLEKLGTIAKISGMSQEEFDKCLANKEQEDAILSEQVTAGKEVMIQGTPTIFINEEKYDGERSLEKVSAAIDNILTPSGSSE